MALLYSNNAKTLLVQDVAATGNTIVIRASDAALFPEIDQEGDWYPLAITNAAGDVEYLSCIGKAYNVLTVQRGREGSQPRAHAIGEIVDLRLTARALDELTSDLVAEVAALKIDLAGYKESNNLAIADINNRIQAVIDAQFEKAGGTINGPVTITGTLTVDGATTLKAGLGITGDGSVSGKWTVGTDLTVNGDAVLKKLTAAATTLASLQVDGNTVVQALKAASIELDGKPLAFPVTSNSQSTAIKLPGNILIQWGRITTIAGDFGTAIYAEQFNGLPSIEFTPVNSAASNPDKFKVIVSAQSSGQFTAECRGFGPSSINWIAIGRGVE